MHESEHARAHGHRGSVGPLNPKAPAGLCLQLGRQRHAFISSQGRQREGGTPCSLCRACHSTSASVLYESATASFQFPVLESTGRLVLSVLGPCLLPCRRGGLSQLPPFRTCWAFREAGSETLMVELEVVWVLVAQYLNPWVKVFFAKPFGKWPQVARAGTALHSAGSDGGRGRAAGWD